MNTKATDFVVLTSSELLLIESDSRQQKGAGGAKMQAHPYFTFAPADDSTFVSTFVIPFTFYSRLVQKEWLEQHCSTDKNSLLK